MKIYDFIEKAKNKGHKAFGPVINSIKNDKELLSELITETQFLDNSYNNIPVGQRFYHLWFNKKEIEQCKFCGAPKKFSNYERFSDIRYDKEHSNYYNTCGRFQCFIEGIREKNYKGQAFGNVIAAFNNDTQLMNELLEKTSFLNNSYENISISQRFYHIWFKKELEICPYCGGPRKFTFNDKFSINQYNKRDSNYCGTCCEKECNKKYDKERTIEGLIKKHGTSNLWEIPGYRENLEKSNFNKFGEKYYTSTKEFKEKSNKTFKEKFGGHPTKLKEVQDKKRKTNLEKYGYSHRLKDPQKYEEYTKTSFQYKDYIFPSGRIERIQGYENFAIDLLLKNHDEKNIIISETEITKYIGKIKYGKDRRYFPDIFLRDINKIIEVKSDYTYQCNLEENIQKREAIIKQGILFEFWIFDKKGNLVIKS